MIVQIWPGHGRDISNGPMSQVTENLQIISFEGLEAAALVGNSDDLHSGHVLQQLAREMCGGAIAGHAVGQSVRVLSCRGEEVSEIRIGTCLGDKDREWRRRDLADRRKVPEGVV